jgi:hemin uptake protein HemP
LNNSKLKNEKSADGNSAEPLRSIPVDANRIDSRDIFIGTREITIGHGGETYRLRLTAQNKLILTK